ncbi:MAG: ATP-binding protein [Clostridia bacterium]|nr:ATP-binding protein [Clostridia bacterium]
MIRKFCKGKIKMEKQTPELFFKNITFNDGTKIELQHNSIIVITGANNSGKSQILKDAENISDDSYSFSTVVLKNVEYEYIGQIDNSQFLKDRFLINQNGSYQIPGSYVSFSLGQLTSLWQQHNLNHGIHTLFIKRLSTEIRLTASNALQRDRNPEQHPIYKLINNKALSEKISYYFNQAFGEDLVVNSNDIRTIPLYVGKAPDKNAFTIAQQDAYYTEISKLCKLENQGDGMRSFASILLDAFTSDHTITLIDEPEAFLHPPQARILGKMLAQSIPNNRQLLVSTHSEDFLQGLLDANKENIIVVRINREGNLNKMNVLKNEEIKKLWSNPILRYSNILSGLFHEKVVVCESDYDCLFYQALINAIYEKKGKIAPDILFTHCGGKTRVKDVVAALKAVNVPVVAICDFDLLNMSQNFKPVIKAFGLDWKSKLSKQMGIIYDNMNAKNSTGIDAWAQIKKIGKAGFTEAAPAAYELVERTCKSAGLFVVPVGEMEGFDKTVNKEKKDWVYYVLENYHLATEPKLDSARKFIQEVIDYKLVTDM